MLHELLKIKTIREQSASDTVRNCQHRLETAKQQVKDKQQALDDYIQWRCQEEQRRYDNIMHTQVKQHDLDYLKQTVALLREKDAELEQAIETAKGQVVTAEQQLDEAREAHRLARQAVEKFEEFTKVLDEEAAKEAQRLEDIEMEEFSVRPNRF